MGGKMNSEILKSRTKKFGLRVITLYDELSKSKNAVFLEINYYDLRLQLAQTTELHAGQNQLQILFIRYRLLKKKLMSLCSG